MMPIQRVLLAIRRSESGNAIVEFALVAPVFVLMVIGTFDLGHTLYTRSMLQGTMEKAGRDFTLERAHSSQASIEDYVEEQVRILAPNSDVAFERKAYFDFADVEQPEAWTDINNDGVCNNGEPFEDANDNGQWDNDRGKDGDLGGARDAVLFTARVTYDRLFPMAGLAGLSEEVTLEASTVLRNQPYSGQDRDISTENCV